MLALSGSILRRDPSATKASFVVPDVSYVSDLKPLMRFTLFFSFCHADHSMNDASSLVQISLFASFNSS